MQATQEGIVLDEGINPLRRYLRVEDVGHNQTSHSRGQVISLDEKNRTATLLLNVDLGTASLALGAAQLLPNGNYHFDSGWITGYSGGPAGRNDEVDKTGATTSSLEFETILYRSFRMPSLYQP